MGWNMFGGMLGFEGGHMREGDRRRFGIWIRLGD